MKIRDLTQEWERIAKGRVTRNSYQVTRPSNVGFEARAQCSVPCCWQLLRPTQRGQRLGHVIKQR